MVDFEVKCYHKDNNERVIGAEVIVYDGDDIIDKITIVDETKLDELTEKLNTLDSTYVDINELKDILWNSSEDTRINATLLNGIKSDKFLKKTDAVNYSFEPVSHASDSIKYGIGTNDEYGHVKITNNLDSTRYTDGDVLSAYQGRVLNDKITTIENTNVKNSLRILIGRYESRNQGQEKNGEFGTRIIANRGTHGLYARILCDADDFDASKVLLYLDINGVSYEFSADKELDNRKLTNATDIKGTVVSGRLGIGADFPTGEHVLLAFARYKNTTIYPATTMKRIEVQ